MTEYAVKEINEILESDFELCRSDVPLAIGWNIVLKTDPGMEPFSFSLSQIRDENLKKVIRNDSLFCIPSIEPYLGKPQKKSQMAIEWLNRVMEEAKRVGLTVNMSCELRKPGLSLYGKVFRSSGI
ncbi:hypothetical protein ES705_25361 [subsurface metagenome]